MKALINLLDASPLTCQNFNVTLYFLGSLILNLWWILLPLCFRRISVWLHFSLEWNENANFSCGYLEIFKLLQLF